MQWRLAKALDQLRAEINAKWPRRSRESDGTIGDKAHESRASDHNPWITDPPGPNVVSGMDITHDPADGCDSYALAEWLRQRRDPRIKYVISNRRIFSSDVSAWQWRSYHGSNPHDHHVHISVKDEKKFYDDSYPWGLADAKVEADPTVKQPEPMPPTLRRGNSGALVRTLQAKLSAHNIYTYVDGSFGFGTERSVMKFQEANGLHVDGVVGPQTWKLLQT